MRSAAVLHGAGYVGRELIKGIVRHPELSLSAVTSRSFAGCPLHDAHAELRGQTDLTFSELWTPEVTDVVFVAAEHRHCGPVIKSLLDQGFDGAVIDMSADFRFRNLEIYERLYQVEATWAEVSSQFSYGVPELFAPYPGRCIANPGCFATGILLALWPLNQHLTGLDAAVTALTGASGSGARAKPTTHYPDRAGNVRAYKVLGHQHLPEVTQFLSDDAKVSFVPVSGPWTRGIWGTVRVRAGVSTKEVSAWYSDTYGESPLIRLYTDALPELLPVTRTPFCDLGWVAKTM